MKTTRTSADGAVITVVSFGYDVWYYSVVQMPPGKSIWDYEDEASWMNDLMQEAA